MSAIDDQRPVHQVDAPGLTVHEAHRAVRVARLSHCRHGRGRPVHRWRRAHRPPVSQYQPTKQTAGTATTTTPTHAEQMRGIATTVVIAILAISLLYVAFIQVIGTDLSHKTTAFGVYFIAVTAALCLNAFTLGTMLPPGDVRTADRHEQHHDKSTGYSRDF